MQSGLALLPHLRMRPRQPHPLLLTAPTAFLPSRKTPLLLTQVSQACMVALRTGDLLSGRKRGQIPQSQINADHAVHDRQQRALDLHTETHVVTPRRIARERHQVRTFNLGQRFGELQYTEFRQTYVPAHPGRSDVLKPQTRSSTLALEPRVTSPAVKEVAKRRVLVPQALSETGRGHLCEPLVPGSALPLRQPPRYIIPRERQCALAVGFGADFERSVPQPATGSEPAIQQTALRTVRVDANPVASREALHPQIITRRRPQRRTQCRRPGTLCTTTHDRRLVNSRDRV